MRGGLRGGSIAKIEMTRVQKIDPKKLEIINHVDGPLLVIAGPGAGKTMAIVERVVNLIGKCNVPPESIFVSTFTEKAAKELLTRISRRLMDEGLKVSPNEMYIGTMHSLFLRILKDYSEFTRLRKNYRTFDDFDQKYTVYRKMYDFRKIENFDLVASAQSSWRSIRASSRKSSGSPSRRCTSTIRGQRESRRMCLGTSAPSASRGRSRGSARP